MSSSPLFLVRRVRTLAHRQPPASSLLTAQLVSVAALAGRQVRDRQGNDLGRVVDLVVRWADDAHPPVTGAVVRVGRRRAFVHASNIDSLGRDGITLRSVTLDLQDFVARPGELPLIDGVLDRQLIDVDGVRVVRSSDLYVAAIGGSYRLVGVDVGFSSLLRRLGPSRWRDRPTPSRVIDWAAVQPTARPGEPLRIGRTRHALHRLRPGELAELMEELDATSRQALVVALGPEAAADVLEEMTPEPLDDLLAELAPDQRSALLAAMAPDEAADALREMDHDERDRALDELPADVRARLSRLLAYDTDTAGGVMTPVLVLVGLDERVDAVVGRLAQRSAERDQIDSVLVVDDDGALIDDVSLFELALADRGTRMRDLVAAPFPVTVEPDEPLDEVLAAFVESRGTSLVVVDGDRRPIGRILADDLVDALLADRRLRRRVS